MLAGPWRPCPGGAGGLGEPSGISKVLGIRIAPQGQGVCSHHYTYQPLCMLDLFLLKAVGTLMSFEDITEKRILRNDSTKL